MKHFDSSRAIGVAQIAALTAGNFGLNYVGERVTSRLRKAFLDGVLRQNTAFFDNIGAGEIATRISNDMSLVQDGISQKVGLIFYGVAGFLSALAISFVRAWELALVLLCLPFVILLVMGVLGSRMKQYAELANAEYAQSGTFAEEVISSIRQVTAYGSQQRFLRKYATTLDSPERSDFIGKLLLGIMMAVMLMIINLGYGLSVRQIETNPARWEPPPTPPAVIFPKAKKETKKKSPTRLQLSSFGRVTGFFNMAISPFQILSQYFLPVPLPESCSATRPRS